MGFIGYRVGGSLQLIRAVLPGFSSDVNSLLHAFYGALPVTLDKLGLSLSKSPRIACLAGNPQLLIACLNGLAHAALLNLAQTLYHVKLYACTILRGLKDRARSVLRLVCKLCGVVCHS